MVINGHWYLFYLRLLMFLNGYFFNNYSIGGYCINGYWWLFRCKPLVVILLVIIDDYFINGY